MAGLDWLGPREKTRRAAWLYLSAWGASTAYLAARGADWIFPVAALVVFGLALSLLVVWLTRGTQALSVPVIRPAHETIGLLLYVLIFYAFIVLGWLFSAINTAFDPGRAHELVLLGVKLLVHVALPTLLLVTLGGEVRGMWDMGVRRPGVLATFLVFGAIIFGLLALISPSLRQIAATGLTPARALPWILLAWAWMSIEAGLCEEYLFRACLQSRLTAWLASPAMGIALTSIIFALVHAPGLYLRGTPETDGWSTDPLQVAAFTIATLSPLSLLLGVMWLRTRSLLLIVLLHGAIDALPHTAEIIGLWR